MRHPLLAAIATLSLAFPADAAADVRVANSSGAGLFDEVYEVFPSLRVDTPETGVPTFKDGILTIPRVDTAERLGLYQNVRLRITEAGTWQLFDGYSFEATSRDGTLYTTSVVAKKIGPVPVQVILIVHSNFPSSCGKNSDGQVNQRREGNRFIVRMDHSPVNPSLSLDDPNLMICPAVLSPFEMLVPLPVFGLKAGTYTYDVNGVTGSFELTEDNNLPAETKQ